MSIKEYLEDEMKRLNRLNDIYEKNIIKEKAINNEPELIIQNVQAMCKIADTI